MAFRMPNAARPSRCSSYLKEGQTATAEELLKYCQDKLAKYKWPTEIEFRKELPKTNVGKVLKKISEPWSSRKKQ